jgi:hypothetical protein
MNITLQCLERDKEAEIVQLFGTHNEEDVVVKTTAYVDDVNSHHTSTQEMSLDEVMTQDYQQWKSILRGTLAPEKCNFYKTLLELRSNWQTSLSRKLSGKDR